jgi:hypothetical protein
MNESRRHVAFRTAAGIRRDNHGRRTQYCRYQQSHYYPTAHSFRHERSPELAGLLILPTD